MGESWKDLPHEVKEALLSAFHVAVPRLKTMEFANIVYG